MSNLTEIFEDTLFRYRSNKVLADSIKKSLDGQRIIPEDEVLEDTSGFAGRGRVCVTANRTMEAARGYPDQRVCVLNFASARNPGGGVVKGATAQEECLCRISTLYPCLNSRDTRERFYIPHGKLDALYNADMIYTPGVTVFKSDTGSPVMLSDKDWHQADVITCAAPNIKRYKGRIKESELQRIFESRLERVMLSAASWGCEVLILGAFGCGAFGNSPRTVATASYKMVEKYRNCFDMMEFAVYCPPGNMENYRVFNSILRRWC